MNTLPKILFSFGLAVGLASSPFQPGVAQTLALSGPQLRVEQSQSRALADVLNELKAHYGITFLYAPRNVEGKYVNGAVRYTPKAEEVLNQVLAPLQLKYKKIKRSTYAISEAKAKPPKEPPVPGAVGSAAPGTVEMENAFAVSIAGRVTDDRNEGLPGVNVLLKGTNTGTTTDVDGRYSLSLPDGNGTLVFSSIGYVTEEVPIGNRTTVDVSLVPDIKSLNEVVVVGYGTQKRSELTGAIASVQSEDIKNLPVKSVAEALQGRVAGVYVNNNGGQPGAAPQVIIRGPVNIRGTSPLYVVDGVPFVGTGANFNVQDIESVEILKDASAAAIYGAQASAGVILITTKKGKAGQTRVGANVNYGIRNVFGLPKLLRRDEYIRARLAFGFPQSDFGDPVNYVNLPDTDWMDEVYQQGKEQNYTLYMTGGSEKSNFYLSTNYQRLDGVRIGNWLERYTLRLNSEHKLGKGNKVKVGETLYGTYSLEDPTTDLGASAVNFRSTPLMPLYDPTNPYGGWGQTPSGFQGGHDVGNELSVYRRNNFYNLNLSTYLEWEITKGLRFRTNGATTFNFNDWYQFNNLAGYGATGTYQETLERSDYRDQNYLGNFTLTYNKAFGRHEVTGLVGYEARKFGQRELKGRGQSPLSALIQNFELVSADSLRGRAVREGYIRNYDRILSQFARLNYSFMGKYLFQFNIRRDGNATKFGPNNKYGVFPSASAGWVISEEAFMKGITPVSNLKVRASWGALGNSDIDNFIFTPYYEPGFVADVGGGVRNSFNIASRLPNPDIQWEEVTTTNLGADVGLFNDRLTLSLDWYDRQTKKMVYSVPLPSSAGAGAEVQYNVGQMQNRGLEFVTEYRNKAGGLEYSIGVNGAFNRNKLISLVPNLEKQEIINGGLNSFYSSANVSRTIPGQPLGQFYGYIADGIYQEDAGAGEQRPRIDDPVNGYIPQAGDLIYRDLNSDGVINNEDRAFIGSPWPKFTYGVTANVAWKGFDARVFFNGVQGVDIYNAGESFEYSFFNDYNTTAGIFQTSFFAGNGLTDKPRPGVRADGGDRNGNWSRPSSYHVQNGSFLRLKNLQFGYTIPAALSQKARIASARIFFMADNLLTFSKYKGRDPELAGGRQRVRDSNGVENENSVRALGIDNGNDRYPLSRLYSIGLNLEF